MNATHRTKTPQRARPKSRSAIVSNRLVPSLQGVAIRDNRDARGSSPRI